MKRYIAVFITVLILIIPFSLSASALSQQINGSASNSTATFYVTISDEDMRSCNGSFSVSGGNISSIALAGNGTLSVNGNSYTYSGGSSAVIVVSCNMANDRVILTSNDATVFDNNRNMVGVASGVSKPVVAPATPTTTKENDTTTTTEETTTEESTTEESTTEETSTTTTTTEIVIAPTRPMPQNNVGGGLDSKLIVVLIVVAANVILAFAVGILLGKRRGESIKYNSDESVEDILGDVEDRFDQSADD